MDSDEFSTWWAGKVTTEDGALNICRKYYGVTKKKIIPKTFKKKTEQCVFCEFGLINVSGGYI